jgi:hypothetical protein
MSFPTKRPSIERPTDNLSDLVRSSTKTVRITVDLDEALYTRLKHKAVDQRESLAAIVRAQLVSYVEKP